MQGNALLRRRLDELHSELQSSRQRLQEAQTQNQYLRENVQGLQHALALRDAHLEELQAQLSQEPQKEALVAQLQDRLQMHQNQIELLNDTIRKTENDRRRFQLCFEEYE